MVDDPLANYTPFSLNLSSSFPPHLVNPNSHSLLSHLKTLASRNPDLLVNEGRIIKDSSMDILESDKTMAITSKDQNEAPVTTSDNNLRGRKRAKFKVIPLPSETDLYKKPTVDLSKYPDPLEFFAAIERKENAEKELRRLRGEPEPLVEINYEALQRRPPLPGLLGKKATYIRPKFSLNEFPDKNESLFSSQETYNHSILSPAREEALPETNAKNLSPATEVSGAKSAMSAKPCELKELLSCNFDGLDDDGVQNLLQEKLNFKLLDIEKLTLPDLPAFRYHEPKEDTTFLTFDGNEAASTKPFTYSYQFEKSPAHGEKNIAVSESLPSPIATDLIPIDIPEDCLRSPIEEENFAVSAEALLSCEAKDVDATSAPIEQDDQIVEGLESVGKEMLSEGSFVENASVNRDDGEMDEPANIQIMTETPNKKKVGSLKTKFKPTEAPTEASQENIHKEPVKKGRKQKAKSNGSVLKEPTNKKRRIEGALPLSSKVDEQLRRQSLYAFGTKSDDGLRRSTRIRMRPLEYWRGERFLYGRVHKSVVSVIGVKYASPAKTGKERGLKVKSFVSDEYKDLVDLASYH